MKEVLAIKLELTVWILESVECIQTLSLPFQGHRSNNSLAKTGKKLYNPERCISCIVRLSQKHNKKLLWLTEGSFQPTSSDTCLQQQIPDFVQYQNRTILKWHFHIIFFQPPTLTLLLRGFLKQRMFCASSRFIFWMKISMSFIAQDAFLLVPLQEMKKVVLWNQLENLDYDISNF